MEEAKWYVVHTRTGYENKVKTDLEKTVENRNMQDLIQEIMIPLEESIEIKDGKKKTVSRKVYPCYLMVKMVMNSQTWYIVRNASGVTGFVGPGSDPIPLSDEEVAAMGVEPRSVEVDFEVGESVRVDTGPFKDLLGQIVEIDADRQKVKLTVSMFGRETSVELDCTEIKKL